MEQWEAALADYKAGMKYREIAEKYGVSESAVKSWAARKWKSQKKKKAQKKVAAAKKEKTQPSPEKLQPHKGPGAPIGNQNAVGNSGGAPKGNENHLKHGIYRRMLWRRQDKETLAAMQDMPHDEEELLIIQLEALSQQEFDCNQAIERYRSTPSGMMASRLVKTTEGNKTSVTTTADSTMDIILRLQRELSAIQRNKVKYIEVLNNIRTARKLNGIAGGDGEEAAVTIYQMPSNGRHNG